MYGCEMTELNNIKLQIANRRALEISTNLTIGPVDLHCLKSNRNGNGDVGKDRIQGGKKKIKPSIPPFGNNYITQ